MQSGILYHNDFPPFREEFITPKSTKMSKSSIGDYNEQESKYQEEKGEEEEEEDDEENNEENEKWDEIFNEPYFDLSSMNETELYLYKTMKERIMFLDGGMGTTIQKFKFTEEDFRANYNDKFKNHNKPLKGDNDLLVLTQPDAIKQIHLDYLEAGSDIIETNTFNATSISQSDYDTQNYVKEININAAKLAKEACQIIMKKDAENGINKKRFVAGAIGPTNKTLSISPSVEDPGYRDISLVFLFFIFCFSGHICFN